jgi:hypothetical protein
MEGQMNDMKSFLAQVAGKIGENVTLAGLVVKTARIKNGAGNTVSDILGWDYIVRVTDKTCFKFYAAQPPLIGMTQPEPIQCPIGIRAFDHYEVDFKKAIEIFNQLDCGPLFVAMSLSWPLTPECQEPLWHIRTSIGSTIVIGANSRSADCHSV